MWDDPLGARIADRHRVVRAADPLRQARPGPVRPARPAADARGEHGRPARRDGRGRARSGRRCYGVSEGGPDVPAVRGDLPGAGDRARPLRHLRPHGRGRRLRHRRPERRCSPPSARSCRGTGGAPSALGMFAPSVAKDKRFREYWGRLLRSASSPKSAVALMDLYRQIDTRSALSSISAPTLVMHRVGRPRRARGLGPLPGRGDPGGDATSSSTATTTCRWSIRTRSSTSWRSS